MPEPALPSSFCPSRQPWNRRDFLSRTAGFGAAAALPKGLLRDARCERPPAARAETVIQIFLEGGLSHIDTFDPKPDAPVDVRGSFAAVPTKLTGVAFTELCRQLGKIADKLTVVRSFTHTEAAHERGAHNMLTGYRPSPALSYPSYGSVVSHLLGMRNDLPPYVCIPNANRGDLGTGYLGAAFGPFSVGDEPSDKDFEVKDLGQSQPLDEERVARRRQLLRELDEGFDVKADGVQATHAFYRQAWQLIDSKTARLAFDIGKEDGKVRDRYGRTQIGQRLLLARRLAEAGVRFVAVPYGGFDHHRQIGTELRNRMPAVDQAVATLIADLDERGMLDRTMVLLTSEFGRTPRINRDSGRDHWPRAFTVVAAGGGLRRGYVHGRTDPTGAEPEEAPVVPADLAATMFQQLGIDPTQRLMSPGDRPIDIVREGRILRELLA